MFRITRPSPVDIDALLRLGAESPLGYTPVGETRDRGLPSGYVATGGTARLGVGDDTFARAREQIRQWAFVPEGWIDFFPPGAPLELGTPICVVARALGLYVMGVNHIVYVIDEPTRFGFGYGTTLRHVERGEERFLIEMDDEGVVTFDIFSYSRPGHVLAWMGYPVTRSLQRRFVREALARMQRGD